MFNKKFIIIIFILSQLIAGCKSEKKHHTLKLAHGLSTEHPVHKAMVFMAKRVSEISEGKMEIKSTFLKESIKKLELSRII